MFFRKKQIISLFCSVWCGGLRCCSKFVPTNVTKRGKEMSLLAGNSIYKVPFNLLCSRLSHTRFFRLRKCGAVKCLKDKEYSTSLPVRYIPKKFREVHKLEICPGKDDRKDFRFDSLNSFQSKTSDDDRLESDISQDSSDKKLHNLSDHAKDSTEDSHCTTGLLEFDSMNNDDESDEGLVTINEKREAEQQESDFRQNNHDAEKCAVELLASRAFTTMELRKKLKAKGFALSVVDRVVREFRSKGLINDYLYAETYSRSRWTSSTWGPGRINQELMRKGINRADAKKAIESVFEEGGADGEESRGGLSKSSVDQLFVQASKKWLLSRNLPSDTRKARIIRWLQYRGFDWGVVRMIVKKLESQHAP
ncbi:hypothetical protein Droror1_Dr00017097 [Drosera rotundifolia]